MSSKNQKVISILLLFSSILVIALFLYGYATRPEITYKLSTIIDYNETHDFSTGSLPIFLYSKNVGDSPVELKIIVRLFNSSLSDFNIVDYDVFKQASIELNNSLKPSEEVNKTIFFTFEDEHEYIAMLFYIEPIRDINPVNSFEESFTNLSQERPTAILMKHIEGIEYMRVKNR